MYVCLSIYRLVNFLRKDEGTLKHREQEKDNKMQKPTHAKTREKRKPRDKKNLYIENRQPQRFD